jgi:DNA-binding response OmpR family regulator
MKKTQTVLIVEDEIALLEVLSDKLKNNGFGVLIAKNGEEGLKLIEHQKPDLVLLDILMPRMDGVTMLRHLRDEMKNKVPVIVLTNLGSTDNAREAKELGADDFLIKADHSLDEVVSKVRSHLK